MKGIRYEVYGTRFLDFYVFNTLHPIPTPYTLYRIPYTVYTPTPFFQDLSSVQRLYSHVERVFLENDALFQPMARYGK